MANERRRMSNFRSGSITDNPLTVGATTFNSAELAGFDVVASEEFRPIVLDPGGDDNGPEIAYVTAHTSSATSATIVRGREGTSAVEHPTGTLWVHAPLISDIETFVDVSERPSTGGLPYEGQQLFENEAPYLGYRRVGGAWVPREHLGAWTTYTPTWSTLGTAATLANGSLTGRYLKIGRTVQLLIVLSFGSSTNGGTGGYSFSLPATAASVVEQQLGAKAFTLGGLNWAGNSYIQASGSTVAPYLPRSAANCSLDQVRNSSTGAVTEGIPVVAGSYTFGNGSNLIIYGSYEAAA
jgi:hypothetical protein